MMFRAILSDAAHQPGSAERNGVRIREASVRK